MTSTSAGTCPRCGEPLEGRRIGTAQMNADAALLALPDRTGQMPCAGCGGRMEKADYCGAKLVFFDRCNPCGLLGIGSEELGAMSLVGRLDLFGQPAGKIWRTSNVAHGHARISGCRGSPG